MQKRREKKMLEKEISEKVNMLIENSIRMRYGNKYFFRGFIFSF
jgi:hypothetical protein